MKLNIYVISHPLIQILTKSIVSNQYTNLNHQTIINNHTQVGTLLIYEVLRKWMRIKNIYIKQLSNTKEITILDYEQNNYIMTNIIHNYNMIAEIENIFPHTILQHIDIKQNDTWRSINLNKVNDKTNLIILEKFLNNENIINLIDYLHKNQNIPFNCIKIACITCTHQILETISIKYTNLNIYTAKIINN